MKILITGASGFIGRHLIAMWRSSDHEVIALNRNADPSMFPDEVKVIQADITDEGMIMRTIKEHSPDVVVHSAAWSKPNDCEMEQEKCSLVNVRGTEHVAHACKTVGARLVFLSTDFVFGHHGPYAEDDATCPVNFYGQSKVLAERSIRQTNPDHTIVRTVMVYGERLQGQQNTFLHWVKDNLEQRRPIKVFTDQYRSITFVNDLCWGIDALIKGQKNGTYHICGAEVYTPFELAQIICGHFNYDANLITPVTKQQFPEVAIRPENSVLRIEKAIADIGFSPTPLQDGLQVVFQVT